MARIVTQLSVYRGRCRRVLGKVINTAGQLTPKKFLRGTEPQKPELANARLEQLWQEVEAEHEHARNSQAGSDIRLLINPVPVVADFL